MRYDVDFVPTQRALKRRFLFPSYNAALRSWIATVAIVEAGYVGEWEEYISELCARDYLEELMVRSPGSRDAVEDDLRPWDERFRAATVEEEKPHLPPLEGEAGWWQYRSPEKWRRPASEELDLDETALAQAPSGAVVVGSSVSPDGSYGAVLTLLPSANDYPMDDLFERVGDQWTHVGWTYVGGDIGGGVTWSSTPGRGVLRWSAEAPPGSIPVLDPLEKAKVRQAPRLWIAYAGREHEVYIRSRWFYFVAWDTAYREEPRLVRFES